MIILRIFFLIICILRFYFIGNESCAIYSGPNYGTVFGMEDISLFDNFNLPNSNYSNFGYTYILPEYPYNSRKAQGFLAGSCKFSVEDIEVFQKK